jgi:hypothetical protein
MNCLQEVDISCPYCGEVISILVDGSVEKQQYIEDCQVCCQPIVIVSSVSSRSGCLVEARHENDA